MICMHMSVDCINKLQAQLFHERHIPIHSLVHGVYQLHEYYETQALKSRVQLKNVRKPESFMYIGGNSDHMYHILLYYQLHK